MRCRPNELCRVLSNPQTQFGGIVDRFVTVLKIDQNQVSEPSWVIEPGSLITVQGIEAQCIPDAWLQPIRDPKSRKRTKTARPK